ncbi:S8 family peptidase [Burkholderia alba]|uniref:S8 family peptidase n=1 Tax=Burkholderia alba TaxID=2683677 RepID=UPI002B05CEED|nr:S8 family peptidase [Burkholderia alba]
MKVKRFNPAQVRFGQARTLAGILSVSLLVPLAGCGGGGGDGPSPTPSTAAPAPAPTTPTPTGSVPSSNTNASCAANQTSSSASSSSTPGNATQDAPVDHLIVKLQGTATASASASGARIMAASSDSTRVNAVIARVMSQWNAQGTQGGQARAYAANVAQPAVQVERTLSDGAALLALGRKMAASDAAALAQAFAADADVAYAEPDRRLFVSSTPTDPLYSQQWDLFDPAAGIDLPNAWNVTTGATNLVTAVLDTGYRPHPDIAANLLPGYNFISSISAGNTGLGRGPDATDPGDWVTQQELSDPSGPFYNCAKAPNNSTWHGTKVAGIIGASANNGIGIAGVNWSSKILPVRVLGKCGGSTSDIADAMRWAAGIPVAGVPNNPTPAKVINLSLGGSGPCGDTFQQAINDVNALGVSVVVAAGNDGLSTSQDRPANCKGVVSVAATDNTGRRAWYSNFGPEITLSAPGSSILSTTNTGTTSPVANAYATDSGTSLAAPQVTGVISLMLSVNPLLTPAQIAQKLAATARPSPVAATASCSALPPGAGILDAAAAVASASTSK